MIVLHRISKSYQALDRNHRVFARLSVRLSGGRHLAILGPKHCGKTTLLRLIAGAEQPDDGRILRDGTVSWPLGSPLPLDGAMTAAENLRFYARIQGIDGSRMIAAADDFAELGPLMQRRYSEYDGQMRQRLLAGLWFALPVDYALADGSPRLIGGHFRSKFRAFLREKRKHARLIVTARTADELPIAIRSGFVLSRNAARFYPDLAAAAGADAATPVATNPAAAAGTGAAGARED